MGLLNALVNRVIGATPASALQMGKAIRDISASVAERQPKSLFFDPLSLSHSLGYKDRKTSLSYDMIKQVSTQLSIVGAIINTRVNQVATFAEPYRLTRTVGFEVKHKDRDHALTRSERKFIVELENFISSCGKNQHNPYSNRRRDNFTNFTKKVIRDRMTFDALSFEIVPDRKGDPFEFVAVDASTIRISVDPDVKKKDLSKEEFGNLRPFISNYSWSGEFDYARGINKQRGGKSASYVQVWQGSITRGFTDKELAYGVSNPRTDIWVNGYGHSEIEQLIDTITAQLWAEQYNRNFFKQGAAPKGILNIRGENIPPEQLEAFRRAWMANVTGVENAWRTPVLQSDEVQYLNLQSTNMEMEYSRWMEYLIKLICAVFLIAPEEIGFTFSAGGMQQPVVETNNEWKLKASKDRGLRPLLKFYANMLNEHVVSRLDDHFYVDFVGLDELTEKERIELRQTEVLHYRTINEIRKDEDLPPNPHGDIIMNPAYLQWLQMQHQWVIEKEQRKEQNEMQEKQMAMQQKQMAMQQEQQQEQMAMQHKQMAMQHAMQNKQMAAQKEAQDQQMSAQQQAMGAPPEGAPPEGAPPEGAPPEGAPPEGAPPEGGGEVSQDEIKEFINSLPTNVLEKLK